MNYVYCPDCPQKFRTTRTRESVRVGELLEVIQSNYSGTGIDMMECRRCGHVFAVSYKVDAIERCPDWEERKNPCQRAV